MSMTSELSASDVALLSGRNSNQNGDGSNRRQWQQRPFYCHACLRHAVHRPS